MILSLTNIFRNAGLKLLLQLFLISLRKVQAVTERGSTRHYRIRSKSQTASRSVKGETPCSSFKTHAQSLQLLLSSISISAPDFSFSKGMALLDHWPLCRFRFKNQKYIFVGKKKKKKARYANDRFSEKIIRDRKQL